MFFFVQFKVLLLRFFPDTVLTKKGFNLSLSRWGATSVPKNSLIMLDRNGNFEL